MRVALAQINPKVADLPGNAALIREFIKRAKAQAAELVVFPELAISGYPPEDFLLLPHFIDACAKVLEELASECHGVSVLVGVPRRNPGDGEKGVFNSAALLQDGKIVGFQDKCLLPTYDVFDERRYFDAGKQVQLWDIGGKRVAVTICEDIWRQPGLATVPRYRFNPVEELNSLQPDFLVNLSSSPYAIDKVELRTWICQVVAQSLDCPVLLCNQVGGNDSLIFDGNSLHLDGKGKVVCHGRSFEPDLVVTDTHATGMVEMEAMDHAEELYRALVLGTKDYFRKQGFTKACLGLSGGIDSAVVACLAAEALGKERVLALGMPSRFTEKTSTTDAHRLAERLGIEFREVPIEGPYAAYLHLLGPYFEGRPFDVTEENLQARIRGMLLMAFSNKLGYIVVSTGNKSELAMGYSTLYGDSCGGIGLISDVVKTKVYALARWINRDEEIIPQAILTKPPSAELRPGQKDSDSLPDYAIVDHVLQDYVEEHFSVEEIVQRHHYPKELVEQLVRRIHLNEYKRRQSPPGLRVTEKAFAKGRHFPIVQGWCI